MKPAQVFLDDLIVDVADAFHGGTIDKGVHCVEGDGFFRLQGGVETGRAGGLNPNDCGAGGHVGKIAENAGDEPTPADRHDNGVGGFAHGGELGEDFGGDGTLADNGVAGSKRLDDGGAGLLGIVVGGGGCLVKIGAGHDEFHHVSAVDFDAVAFLFRGGGGHVDAAGNAHAAAGEGHPLGVVAGGGGDDTGGALGVGKLRYSVDGAPDFIGADVLEVFAFQIDFGAGEVRKSGAVLQWGGGNGCGNSRLC